MKDISEQQLIDSLENLPREREPGKDLWPGIDSRLHESADSSMRTMRPQKRFAIAAMLAVAVIAGYQVGLQRGAVVNQENMLAAYSAYRLDNMSSEYVGAIREAAALTAQQTETRMPPETVEEMQTSMKNILQTETMLREAIKNEPDNEYLAKLLIRLQARQLQLIQEIPQIEQQIWRTL